MEENKAKWYFKTSVLVIALLSVGPLALPLLWFNPRFRLKMKILISVGVIILTYWLAIMTIDAVKNIMSYL